MALALTRRGSANFGVRKIIGARFRSIEAHGQILNSGICAFLHEARRWWFFFASWKSGCINHKLYANFEFSLFVRVRKLEATARISEFQGSLILTKRSAFDVLTCPQAVTSRLSYLPAISLPISGLSRRLRCFVCTFLCLASQLCMPAFVENFRWLQVPWVQRSCVRQSCKKSWLP